MAHPSACQMVTKSAYVESKSSALLRATTGRSWYLRIFLYLHLVRAAGLFQPSNFAASNAVPMSKRNLLICFDAFGTLFKPKRPIQQQYGEVARSLGLGGFSDEDVNSSFKAGEQGRTRTATWYLLIAI